MVAAIERARTLPLARWLHALAIPEVGEETAHDLASAHATIGELADSPILNDVLALERLREKAEETNPRSRRHGKLEPAQKEALAAGHAQVLATIAETEQRLEKAGFAKRTAKKTGEGFVVTAGPVAAQAVLNFFASPSGQRVLARLCELGIEPKGGSGAAAAGHPLAGKTLVLTGSLATLSRTEAGERIRAAGGNLSSSVSKKTDYLIVGESPGSKLDDARALNIPELDEAAFVKLLGGTPKAAPVDSPTLFD